MNKLTTPWHVDQLMAACAPVDTAFAASERKWGVGRLECLVSSTTLASYHRGWKAWRAAIEDGDGSAAEAIGPKMIAALAFMDREAEGAGHTQLACETWETPLEDGRVLVVVRTNAEASRLAQAASLGSDGMIPVDLAAAIRHQHEGRHLVVWTMAELARVLPQLDLINEIKRSWPGSTVEQRRVTKDGDVADWARSDPVRTAMEGISQ